MLQLNQTGYMHNRLRMVAASFLAKDLGIDWRLGERYFADLLNDFDFSANKGGWQWAASTGYGAQPYSRIFNPLTRSEKFDPDGRFIKRYLPQLANLPAKWIHARWLAGAERLAEFGAWYGAGIIPNGSSTRHRPASAHWPDTESECLLTLLNKKV
ncbi:deoxyribodipyrimidine photolyase [Paraburkholderia sp. HC6.4b]|nr:deoxyribodipyrimidine photolyase [Paraburkholderia sp. HC6.4b]MBB5449321.1 deoxyribodipyrimidine photolyase [Paraburkholderia sp. Kb1A]